MRLPRGTASAGQTRSSQRSTFLQYILHILGLLICISHAIPSSMPIDNGVESIFSRAPKGSGRPRDVNLRLSFLYDTRSTKPNGLTTFAHHTALEIDENKADPKLKMDIVFEGADTIWRCWLNPDRPPKGGELVIKQGQTTLTNEEIIGKDGKGPAWTALVEDPEYRTGPTNNDKMNTCHNFVSRMLRNMDIQVTDEAQKWMTAYDNENKDGDKVDRVKSLVVLESSQGKNGKMTTKAIQKFIVPPGGGKKGCKKRDGACPKAIVTDGGDDGSRPWKNELITLKDQSGMVPEDFLDPPESDFAADAKPPPPDTISGPKGATVGFAKADGALKTFTMVGKEALGALGVAGTVVGAAFVILDFVGHNWVGGAIGSIGLLAGTAAGIAISGPIGWVVGGAIMALFAILPGLFKKQSDPAERTDVQGIIQWKLFGDPKHTGNEQCQKGTSDVPGNPDCQALYGAGTLHMALGLNNFDSIVFLEQFNNGYPMTIKDMAANFYVVNEHKKGDGADKLATITCHNTAPLPAGRAGVIGGDNPKWCNKPEFAINRPLIHLPKIDDTADRVYNRIIPAPNGDCKLVTYPGSQYFESYNVTLTGLPSAIACGLNNLVNLDGTEVPINGDQPGGTDGSQSTDGQGGAVVKAPPPAPFKSLAQTDYACIFHGSDQPFCLPPGTYHKQSGLGFEVNDIDSLTLPLSGGWSLSTHWQAMQEYRSTRPGRQVEHTYSVNQDPTKKSNQLETYKTDWYGINANRDGQSRFHISAPNDGPDPVCCLFTEPSFGGDVWCVGVGGGDILPQWKDKPQSVSCHAGGQVWLYADRYNDEGGVLIRGNVEDLKDEPYGPDKGSFSKNVKAMWVLPGN